MKLSRRDILRYGGAAAAGVLPMKNILFGSDLLGAAVMPATTTFTGVVSLPAGFTVPAGQVWEFNPAVTTTVTVQANVIVQGTLRMRPANAGVVHALKFTGVNEAGFVGGHTVVPLASDVGLWVTGAGVLDAQGTARAGWNRTGNDPTWLTSDELVVAPNVNGDTTGFRSFVKGSAVPVTTGPDGVVYPTEVANLTRNVRIEGTATGRAHIMFLACTQPQTVKHVAVRWMCPTQPTGETYLSGGVRVPIDKNVVGRYALHFHMCGDGTRPTIIEGVVCRDLGGTAFVPHLSNGITFRDCIAYDLRDAGFWWDPDTLTHAVTFERCAAMLIRAIPSFRGNSNIGFNLSEGTGMVVRDCVAVGVQGNKTGSGGFHWPATANHGENVWLSEDNISHNNRGPGISVWQNDGNPHLVQRFVSYHSGVGLAHGAYVNTYTYRDLTMFGNTSELDQHAIGGILFERLKFYGDIAIVSHGKASLVPTRYVNCLVTGVIKVKETGTFAGVVRFESTTPTTDLTPAKFVVTSRLSTIAVVNSDGSTFTVTGP